MQQSNPAAAMAARPPSRVVFVGNIPWDRTEEDLKEIFSSVGPIRAFRMLHDRETGKSRGYGFCEFEDAETASSAIRNLNGYDVGGRFLRVDYAENDQMPSAVAAGGPAAMPSKQPPAGRASSLNLPPTLQPAAAATPSVEVVNRLLSTMQPAQLMDIITQIKQMASQHYEQARQLLEANPSLAYALYQAMHQMNLIDLTTQQRARSSGAKKGSSGSASAPPPPPPPTHPQAYASERDRSLPMPLTAPGHGSPSVGYMPPSAQPRDVAGQERLVRQIMSMSVEQINALPPDQRDQVMRVRAQMMGQHLPH